jgi:NAD(P)-dependent dehydrogenase (short-subunit alcohol dehydrogenase family)
VSVRDRVVLVTGASSGIGRATALLLAERGATVVGVARRAERLRSLEEALQACSPRSYTALCDVGRRQDAEGAVAEAERRFGRLDVLVNNAAIPKHKHIWHTRAEDAEEVMRINFLGCVWTAFAALPGMLERGEGTIVNVSSIAGRVVPAREPLYAASKAALDAFSFGLATDLQGSGLHAGSVVVGPIDTEIWDKLDEPPAFAGRKHPPERAARAILQVIEKRRHEVFVPRWSPPLLMARLLRCLAPGLLRAGMRSMEPVSAEVLAAARRRAAQGLPLGAPDPGDAGSGGAQPRP